MPKPNVEIEGLSQLSRELKALDAATPQAIKAINREMAELVVPFAHSLVPIGETKQLSGSIRTGATLRSGYVAAGGLKVPYAAPIHWGWPLHNIEATNFLTLAAERAEPAGVALAERQYMALVRQVGL